MDLTSPAADELELSVFGRGYGEAICVHLGDGEWIVVDSCINPQNEPAALGYLRALGLSAADVVSLVIATHWDDDHIRGLSQVVAECSGAKVACPAALNRKDIFAFVVRQESAKGASGSGLDEFRALLRLCRERGTLIVWAKANVPLHPIPPGDAPRVVALSPSDDAFERSIVALIEQATASKSDIPRQYRAPEGPNGASVAACVRHSDVAMLLGADLEISPNAEAGWEAVVSYSIPPIKASIVKVPHHGSPGAHHDGMWSDLLVTDPVAILTPWARGRKYLPSEADLARLCSVSRRVFLTAMPSLTRARKDRDLENMIRRLHGERIWQLRGWGHVRARRGLNQDEWRVELAGDAVAVDC